MKTRVTRSAAKELFRIQHTIAYAVYTYNTCISDMTVREELGCLDTEVLVTVPDQCDFDGSNLGCCPEDFPTVNETCNCVLDGGSTGPDPEPTPPPSACGTTEPRPTKLPYPGSRIRPSDTCSETPAMKPPTRAKCTSRAP